MATDIVMLRLPDSMEEGTILRWIKSQGDEVAVRDELVEIETDKANMVYEADASGALIEIRAEGGDMLPIGEVIARVAGPGEEGGDGAAHRAESAAPQAEESAAEGPSDQSAAVMPAATPLSAARAAPPGRGHAMGAVRRWPGERVADRAADRAGARLDLAGVSGSGAGDGS
jgi:pyruvate dehydrogenase E2 component (dihydrolipoamide acetyltransferase)